MTLENKSKRQSLQPEIGLLTQLQKKQTDPDFFYLSTEKLINMPTVSIVIPALNEGKNLPHVLPKIPTWVHEVILVDGNSVDDTIAVAKSILPDIRIITQEKRGKGIALRTGFAAAEGDIIVMLDADGSMDPAEIPAFVSALLVGADFAKGSRFLHGGGTHDM